MPFSGLREFLQELRKNNEILEISEYVDPVLEITEVTDRISKQPGGGKALLFKNTGSDFPVLINSLGSLQRMCLALGRSNLDEIGTELESLLARLMGPKDNIWDKLRMLPEVRDMDLPSAGVAHNLSIVKIAKSYPGHALKVMNALWGAGQMMFNKILVVVDEEADIHDYSVLARKVFSHFNPAMDLHFSLGPLDVLDHSSDFMAYGGKVCIDATKKLPEEKSELSNHHIEKDETKTQEQDFENVIPEIAKVNALLLKDEIPVIIVSVNKMKLRKLEELARSMFDRHPFKSAKIVIVVDKEVDVTDVESVVWLTTGNIDPRRDSLVYQSGISKGGAAIKD